MMFLTHSLLPRGQVARSARTCLDWSAAELEAQINLSGEEPEERVGEALGAFEPLTAGHLFFLLHHLVRQRENALGRELAQTGLTLSQWQVLATLSRLDKATMARSRPPAPRTARP